MSAIVAVFRRELRIALRRPAEWAQPSGTPCGIVAVPAADGGADEFSGDGR